LTIFPETACIRRAQDVESGSGGQALSGAWNLRAAASSNGQSRRRRPADQKEEPEMRRIAILLALTLITGILAGCTKTPAPENTTSAA
jgi:hypothetical protein